MHNIFRIITQASERSLAFRSEGPPTFPEPRISIEGTPQSFRMLAELLHTMAETVESDLEIRECGWRLVLGPDEAPALRMAPGSLLALDCEPESSDRG